jgi:hypothetical protein
MCHTWNSELVVTNIATMLEVSKWLTFGSTENERIGAWYLSWVTEFLEHFAKTVVVDDKSHWLNIGWLVDVLHSFRDMTPMHSGVEIGWAVLCKSNNSRLLLELLVQTSTKEQEAAAVQALRDNDVLQKKLWNVLSKLKENPTQVRGYRPTVSEDEYQDIVARWVGIIEKKELLVAKATKMYNRTIPARAPSPMPDEKKTLSQSEMDVEQSWADLAVARKLEK